jgi:hypothetical protein
MGFLAYFVSFQDLEPGVHNVQGNKHQSVTRWLVGYRNSKQDALHWYREVECILDCNIPVIGRDVPRQSGSEGEIVIVKREPVLTPYCVLLSPIRELASLKMTQTTRTVLRIVLVTFCLDMGNERQTKYSVVHTAFDCTLMPGRG